MASAALGVAGGFLSSMSAFNANMQQQGAGAMASANLGRLLKKDPIYTTSPYAQERYNLAHTILNSRMPGAATIERGIYNNTGNTVGNIKNNVTDSSQALSLITGLQGQGADQINKLGVQEGQDYYKKLDNLTGAQDEMTKEHQNLFDDSVRRWQDKLNGSMANFSIQTQGNQSSANAGGAGGGILAGLSGFLGGGGNGGSQGGQQGGGIFSDKRLKHNIQLVGKSPSGINIYQFSYNGSDKRYQGVLAQEVPHASFKHESNYLMVDYSKIDVTFKSL